MIAIAVTKTQTGGYIVTISGGINAPKYVSKLEYVSFNTGIRLIDADHKETYPTVPYTGFTVNGVSGFASTAEVCAALDSLILATSSPDDLLASLTGNQGVFGVLITRPANTTAYSAYDVVGNAAGTLNKIINVAKSAGKTVSIKRVRIQTNDTNVSGLQFDVVFHADDIAVIADNAPYVITPADYLKRAGMVSVIMGLAPYGTVGDNDTKYIKVKPVDRDIRVKLVTPPGFVPSANSTWFYIAIDVELDN